MQLDQQREKHTFRSIREGWAPRPITEDDAVHEHVLSLVGDTANAVLAKKAANDLNRQV